MNDHTNITSMRVLIIAIAAILVITSIGFYPAVKNGFVWDDDGYIATNHLVKKMSVGNLKAIMTTPVMSNYHPLTILSYSWEYFFFKLNPAPYHVINVLFHLANCILVFLFILRLSKSLPVACITSLLFGIHPLHVESVAWISERKDVLYTLFYLISLICYLSYIRKTPGKKYYYYTLFFFAFSLLSKPMAVTLPLVLFLIDYLENRAIDRHLVIEKIPFFALSAALGVVTLFTQDVEKLSNPDFAFPKSIFLACRGLIFYLEKTFIPVKLGAMYRQPLDGNLFAHMDYLFAPIIVFCIALAVFFTRKYTRKAIWGSLFYFITLLPVIQLLPIGLAMASDRYTYVPLIGIFYICAEFLVWLWHNKLNNRTYLKFTVIIIGIAIVAQLVFLTNNLTRVWKNTLTLWSNVARHYPETEMAHNNLGCEYLRRSEYDKALQAFFKAIKIHPSFAAVHSNICYTYFLKGDLKQAGTYCDQALAINPKLGDTYAVLGDIYWPSDKVKAMEMYKKSISLSPHFSQGHLRLCKGYISLGQFNEAYPYCMQTIKYNPDNTTFSSLVGNEYLNVRLYREAHSFYSAALSINPYLPEVHNNLAILYYNIGDYKQSVKHLDIALSLGYEVHPEIRKRIDQHRKKD